MSKIYYKDNNVRLYKGDCINILDDIEEKSIDMIFADPPYFLSNGGITCKSGKMSKVDKGKWDKVDSFEEKYKFNKEWISKCKRVLKDNGTMWISGTIHNIYVVGFILEELGFKILNNITWEKTNPPPNISCRYFTHSTETILWVRKEGKKNSHFYNYKLMREINDNKQMKDVWTSSAISRKEKVYGNHPTQKPEWLLERIILASTKKDSVVLDPFNGSGTTGVVSKKLDRKYIGIDVEEKYLGITKSRLKELDIVQLTFDSNSINSLDDNQEKTTSGKDEKIDMIEVGTTKPFVKWAGGKTELLPVLEEKLPQEIKDSKEIGTYIEPFVGAGAVFIYLSLNYKFKRIIINDINYKLINVYESIKNNCDELIEDLEQLKQEYLGYEEDEDKKEMYLRIRDEFNDWKSVNKIKQAANFIFINKTCFNGLYRENKSGGYNVPWGQHKNPSIYDKEQIINMSKILNAKDEDGNDKVIICCGQYKDLEKYVDVNTLVYMDPPYRPITKSGFTSYNKGGFNDDAQIELAKFYEKLSDKGAKVMLSNSDPKNYKEDDEFFDDLYGKFNVQRVNASRMINSKGTGRGKVKEILVTNF